MANGNVKVEIKVEITKKKRTAMQIIATILHTFLFLIMALPFIILGFLWHNITIGFGAGRGLNNNVTEWIEK